MSESDNKDKWFHNKETNSYTHIEEAKSLDNLANELFSLIKIEEEKVVKCMNMVKRSLDYKKKKENEKEINDAIKKSLLSTQGLVADFKHKSKEDREIDRKNDEDTLR